MSCRDDCSDWSTCQLCGSRVSLDWSGEHYELHTTVRELDSKVADLQLQLDRLRADVPEVGFRGPAYDEPI